MSLDSTTTELLDILHRGGAYGYWWVLETRHTIWWEVGARAPLPTGRRNVYFGVYPTTEIPTTNMQGERKPARELRAQLPLIAALNCLYCEFDAKDYDDGKAGALAAAEAIDPPPSVLIDSGGGYHLYWLFHEPWLMGGDDDRERAKRLQAAWVAYTGGDPAVKDLARVLRVPGTHNYKYDPAPLVTVIAADFDRRYTHDELAGFCAAEWSALSTPPEATHSILPLPNGTSHYDGRPAGHLDRYVRAALDGEALRVLRAPAGMKHDTIRDAAISLGTLIARGVLEETTAFDELARAADAHRSDVQDSHRTIRDGLAYGRQHPRLLPEPRTHDPAPRVRLSDVPADDPPHPATNAEDTAPALPLLIRADQLSSLPPAEPIIPNLLYVNTLHQWFGAPGSGKSFLALDVAATIAQTRRVVYIAAEAIEDYESRLDAWQAHHGRTAGALYFWRQPLALASERDVQQFIAAISAIEPAAIIIDPLADCMTGLDESSAKDMSITVFALNTIRRHTRAAVLAIHHTGWSQDHERGHSILRGACRVVVRIEAREDGLIRLVCEKKNHGPKFDPRSFRLIAAGTKGGALPLPARQVMAGKLRLTEKLLLVLEALTTTPLRKGATHTDLLKHTAIPAATLNRALTSLEDAGYIRGEETGRSTKYHLMRAGSDALDLAAEETSDVWGPSGRTLEEGGRSWNWDVVIPRPDAENTPSAEWKNDSGNQRKNGEASSTGLPHSTAVLPNTSKVLPLPPVYISEGYIQGVDEGPKVLPRQSWGDDAAADDESGLFDGPVPERATAAGLVARLKAMREQA